MKLRTAYFCRNCDEEIDLEKIIKTKQCPYCGFSTGAFSQSLVYAWKVEVPPPFKKLTIGRFKEGDSCPIDTLDKIKESVGKEFLRFFGLNHEEIEVVPTKRHKVSNR